MPNAEDVNNRVKLFFHRLIARRIGRDPSLLDVARHTLVRQRERANLDCYDEWDRLLRLDVAPPATSHSPAVRTDDAPAVEFAACQCNRRARSGVAAADLASIPPCRGKEGLSGASAT